MRTTTATFIVNGEKITKTVRDNTFHATRVTRNGGHGYPFRSECSVCEWKSNTYASAEAAMDMGTAHCADTL